MTDTAAPERIPFVDYLVLDEGDPHLVAQECTKCGARYFDRRNACAGCFGTDFRSARIATDGEVRSFTIVTFAAPGVEVPFVAAVVDCDGTSVRGNIVNCPPDPEHVALGMQVSLVTTSMGTDHRGVEAINYGFEPASTGGDQTPSDQGETNQKRAAAGSASDQGRRLADPTSAPADGSGGETNQNGVES